MGKTVTRTMKKEAYDKKFCALLEKYDTAFLVHADNVGSKQFQMIRTVRAQKRIRRQTPKASVVCAERRELQPPNERAQSTPDGRLGRVVRCSRCVLWTR